MKIKKGGSSENIDNTSDVSNPKNFPIIGIGASAGGLAALEQFFSCVPENSEMAFVVIQHLDPTHVGILPELLQRTTSLKVLEVEDNMPVEINCVFVIPSNTSMSLEDNRFKLSEPAESRGLRLPIDYFFKSLAISKKSLSVGIVLSGLGSDGSEGARQIKDNNGIVLVQDPATAAFNSMPLSAIDAVVVDVIAPANELFVKLLKFLRSVPVLKASYNIDESDHLSLEKILILLRNRTGNDFSLYKKNTIIRRVERRMSIHRIDEISEYARYMHNNPSEIDIFFKELIIGVTSFFRDQMVWDKLKDVVIPEMIQNLTPGSDIRAWVAGCSTGEEAYSLAIVFHEVLSSYKTDRKFNLQIFATDLDNDAVQTARSGVFSSCIADSVSPYRLQKYFTKRKDEYKINNEIRELIVFAQHNLIMNPPFTNIDLISCRNVLIYIDSELQKKIIRLFNYSLKLDGVLLLGSAETTGQSNNSFATLDSKLKLFKRSSSALVPDLINFPSTLLTNRQINLQKAILPDSESNVESMADKFILENFSPVTLLLTENGDIVYIRGVIAKYLNPAVGKASMNIFPMLKDGLKESFPAAFKKAQVERKSIYIKNVRIGKKRLQVNIRLIEKPDLLQGTIMVTFVENCEINYIRVMPPARKKFKYNLSGLKVVNVLFDKLNPQTKTQRNFVITDIKKESGREDLIVINEILQAANEDLTTSREEMQSLNEELQTVNSELIVKAEDYVQLTNDMKNLLNSTDIKILILDNQLNIRRYTNQTTNIFKIIKSDIGRPFTDLVSVLIYPEFVRDAQNVLDTLLFSEKQVQSLDGGWYLVRIMPYLTLDDKIDGLVMTFIAISDQKNAEVKVNDIEKQINIISGICNCAIIKLLSDFTIISLNSVAENYFGRSSNEVLHINFIDLFVPKADHKKLESLLSNADSDYCGEQIEFSICKPDNKCKKIKAWVVKNCENKKIDNEIIIIIKT